MDSESKHSFKGSFLQPPDKILPAAFAYRESKKLTAVGGDRLSPIPNNQAVVAALKTLQEKIHCLELERSQAEDNLCSLSTEAAQYKKALEHESYKKNVSHQELMQQRKGISLTQSRCSLLEKQLDYMKKMVSSAELEKNMVLEQQTQLQKEKNQNQVELHAKLEKLEVLEKQCYSENCRSNHSVSANVQSVLHIMKHRNPRFSSRGQERAASGISGQTVASKSVSSCSTSSTFTRNLSDLLLALEDELGQMSFEHQELLKQIQETHNSEVCEDLERDLDCLVKKMEIKGEHISKLKKHQASVQKIKQKTQKLKQEAAHVKLKCGDQKETKEIPVAIRESRSKACPGQKSKSSLQLLKNVQKLQSTLKRDDIMWEQ
uniref:Centrosomal protein 57kDa-like protein 1 n=1 Tax=Apteryx owenii TaxID=8824 RepID=A0A8B9QM63_APTOW